MMTRIHVEYHGHAALLTLDHAPANTLTLHGLQAFQRLLAEVASHPEVVVLVLSGQGAKFFSAGADLKQFAGDDKVLAREVLRPLAKPLIPWLPFPESRSPSSMVMPWAEDSSWHWLATSASPCSMRCWPCQRHRWDCFPVPGELNVSPSWWGRAGPSA